MNYLNTSGLVLRETAYKESSKILTVLTAGEGKLTVTAKGALRKNSKTAAATQQLAYSEMTLACSRDRWTLTEAGSVEQFIGLRSDLSLLALGSYFAELAEAVADEDAPSPELLPLCLNALFALSEGLKEQRLIKPAFELRLMSASGYTPLVTRCAVCGSEEPGRSLLDVSDGLLYCGGCAGTDGYPLGPGALKAMRYILGCPSKKLFSFSLGGAALKELAAASEGHVFTHLERGFRTLDYYKGLL